MPGPRRDSGWKPGARAQFLPETSSCDKHPSCPGAGAGRAGQGLSAQMLLLILACTPQPPRGSRSPQNPVKCSFLP